MQRLRRGALLVLAALVATTCAWALTSLGDPPSRQRVGLVRAEAAPLPVGPLAAPAVAWCGAEPSATDRKPDVDRSSARQVHVLYAFPADGEDRFASLASAIATDVGAIDGWWRAQDPARAPRWDRFAFPGCSTTAGALDLVTVRLPRPAAAYRDSEQLEPLVSDLLAVVGPLEKSLVYYDGPRSLEAVCGSSELAPLYAGRLGFSFVFVRAACNGDLGSGGTAAVTAAHELTHSLGAVQLEGPPNRCLDPSRAGHVCDDVHDLMFPYSVGLPLAAAILDARRDDYYGHAGAWWDVRNSDWLSRLPQRRLTVTVRERGGTGTVVSDPAGIACAPSCEAVLDDGLRVSLRAAAGPGSRLWSWEGSCSGWSPVCAVTLDGSDAAVATFGPERYRISVRVRGRGRVLSVPGGLACTSGCGAWFAPRTVVRLRAVPAPGRRFDGWTGACRGRGACVVTADRDLSVGATFART